MLPYLETFLFWNKKAFIGALGAWTWNWWCNHAFCDCICTLGSPCVDLHLIWSEWAFITTYSSYKRSGLIDRQSRSNLCSTRSIRNAVGVLASAYVFFGYDYAFDVVMSSYSHDPITQNLSRGSSFFVPYLSFGLWNNGRRSVDLVHMRPIHIPLWVFYLWILRIHLVFSSSGCFWMVQ